MNYTKRRNVVVTILLWIIVVLGLVAAIYSIIHLFNLSTRSEILTTGADSILFSTVALSAVLMLKWNRFGYYMFAVANLAFGLIHLVVVDDFALAAYFNLSLIVILWGVLQIPRDRKSAWTQMKMSLDYKHCRHIYQLFGILYSMSVICTIVSNQQSVPHIPETQLADIRAVEVTDTLNVENDEPSASAESSIIEDEVQYSDMSIDQLWKIIETDSRDSEALYRLAKYYYKRDCKSDTYVRAFWKGTLVPEGDIHRYLPSNKKEFSSVRFVFVMLARAYTNMSPSINTDIQAEVINMLEKIKKENPGYRYK